MYDNAGVLSALQSLAGVYVHDYLIDETIRGRVDKKFASAEFELRRLIQHQASLTTRGRNEILVLLAVLSVQDINLPERRLKKPCLPRWLLALQMGEQVLHLADQGQRFYDRQDPQTDALQSSLSVIIGSGVILAQPMIALPSSSTFDIVAEARRFGFLLSGSEREVYEVHGGCGFSKRLLHMFSQITLCSARMIQEPQTPIIPVTAKFLYDGLLNLRQWNGKNGHGGSSRDACQPITWIRAAKDGYVLDTAQTMAEVTAETWRIAAMIYLQCRLLR